uniref:Uncharacterized protein n=1 Tax=Cacopsylla melanoneura TaxID=428564 RepID=A0A8D8YNG9_9HEMI
MWPREVKAVVTLSTQRQALYFDSRKKKKKERKTHTQPKADPGCTRKDKEEGRRKKKKKTTIEYISHEWNHCNRFDHWASEAGSEKSKIGLISLPDQKQLGNNM